MDRRDRADLTRLARFMFTDAAWLVAARALREAASADGDEVARELRRQEIVRGVAARLGIEFDRLESLLARYGVALYAAFLANARRVRANPDSP